jgi:hypothetical protein
MPIQKPQQEGKEGASALRGVQRTDEPDRSDAIRSALERSGKATTGSGTTRKTLVASEIERGPIEWPPYLVTSHIRRGSKGRPVGKSVYTYRKMPEDFEVVGPDGKVITSGKEGDWLRITRRVSYSFPSLDGNHNGPLGLDVSPLRMSYTTVSKEDHKRYSELEKKLRDRTKSAKRED